MIRTFKIAPCLVLIALIATAGPVAADSLLTLRSHTDGFKLGGQVQAAKDSEVKVWISGEDKVRRDDGDTTAILRLDRNKLYLVNHAERTYSALDLPIELRRLAPGREARVDQLSGMMKLSVQLTSTQETKKVGSFKAQKVELAIATAQGAKVLDTFLWVSKEAAGYRAYNRLSASLTALQPGAADLARQLEALAGFPVLQETTLSMDGKPVRSREELAVVETKEAPAGTYDPPAGYAAKPYDVTQSLGGDGSG